MNKSYKTFEAMTRPDIEEELRYKFGIKDEPDLPEYIEKEDWEGIVDLIINSTKYNLVGVSWKGGCKAFSHNVYHFVAEW